MSPPPDSPDEEVNILLVDDQPEGLLALETTLEPLGQNLVKAASAGEALRLLLREDFALILLDVVMPGIDGFETAQYIRARERSRHTPIIFLTALSKGEIPELRAYAVGAVDYVVKPYEQEILRSKVSVFVDLARKNARIRRQERELRDAQQREHERQLTEAMRAAEMERARVREDELRRAVRMRDDFLTTAAHELRTPLTSVKITVQSMVHRMLEGDQLTQEHLLKRLERVDHGVEQLARLVEQLLDISRLTSGRLSLELAQTDLSTVARDVVSRFSDDLHRTGNVLSASFEEGVVGMWDRFRLDQVLTNLLANALKYAPGQPVELSVRQDQGAALLEVRDHGAGIDPADHARIFERFERIGDQPGISGFGLGLWIVRSIVEALGGTVWAESPAGGGAAFKVRLPLAAGASAEDRAKACA